MELSTPFWFKQRQCKLEPAGDNTIKVTGPNLPEAVLHVAKNSDGWKAGLRLKADGPDVATAEADQANEKAAWNVAFELYRTHVLT